MRSQRTLQCLAVFCFAVLAALSSTRGVTIISEGDSWRYFKGTSMPSPGSTWTTNGFDDSGWLAGQSGFGYGDGDDHTVLNDMTNSVGGYVTVFTRKTFLIPDTNAVTTLTLGADYDDGFVAYINGTEVARRTNTTVGAISNTTLASGNHEASRGDSSPMPKALISISPSVLLPGMNVIAVVGNNASTNSSDLSLIIDLSITGPLVRGPFIQMPNSDEVTVVWLTASASDSVVDYGLDTSYSGGTVSNSAPVTNHVVNIAGLLPGTNYYYRVSSGGVVLSAGEYFKTKRSPSQPFRFMAIGDWGDGGLAMSNVAIRAKATDFDFYITVGDNIYDFGEAQYYDPRWFSLYRSVMARAPVFPCVGNHDVYAPSLGQPFVDNFYLPTNGPSAYLERNYSYDYGNAHFTVIDANPFTNVTANLSQANAIKTWVSNDLASTTQPWKFVYYHQPGYSSTSTSHGEEAGVVTNLAPLFAAAGVHMVFQGHSHWYERQNAINGVYYVTTGVGGAGLNGLVSKRTSSAYLNYSSHGFTLVDVGDTLLQLNQIDPDGVTLDSFNLDRLFKINSAPANQTVCPGQSASLSVSASGTGALSYQWRKPTWGTGNGWQLSTSGNAGYFTGTSSLCGVSPGIDTSATAFGLYANSGGQATALRDFPAMVPGDSFAIDYKNPRDMDANGTITVFGLHDSAGVNRFELYFQGGNVFYTINDANPLVNSSGIGYTSGGLHIVFTLVTANTYNLSVTRLENNQTFTFTGRTLRGTAGSAISRVRLFYANNSATGGSCRDFFVNNLNVAGRADDASDPTYAGGWSNGQNGGTTDLRDGGSIFGATTSTLNINPTTPSDAGNYSALVSNSYNQSTVTGWATLGFFPVCVTITGPPDASYTTNATIVVSGTASATSTVSSVSVNGTAATTGNLYSNWTATVSGLTGGTNLLVAVAADSASHTATNTSHVIYADATFDGNSDGLPDAWQIQYFGSPDAPAAGPNIDGDNDGFSNNQEYVAGTDPTDSTSALRVISVAGPGGPGFKIEWAAVSGKNYSVEYSDDLIVTNWIPLTTVTATGSGNTNVVDGTVGGATQRFYRVRIP